MTDLFGEPVLAALIGLFGGVLLGLAARLGRFCSLGAIEDALYAADTTRAAQWAVALGTAMLGVAAAIASDLFDPAASFYATEPFSPVVVLGGALLFGYGMALSGTCGFGALARLGGGDIRAGVIVVTLGIMALVTVSGPLAPLRVLAVAATDVSLDPRGIASAVAGPGAIPFILALTGLATLGIAAASPGLRSRPGMAAWAAVAGGAIVSGWLGTTWIARTGFDGLPVQSHSYSAPPGDTILWLMTASGGGLGFGVGSVAGVVLGAVLGSAIRGEFRWEACEDARELRRQIAGAAFMGVGAVLALGCTVGEGLTAMSILAWPAPLAACGIVAGAVLGLRQLVEGRILPD